MQVLGFEIKNSATQKKINRKIKKFITIFSSFYKKSNEKKAEYNQIWNHAQKIILFNRPLFLFIFINLFNI